MRCCTENGVRLEDGSRPLQIVGRDGKVNIITPLINLPRPQARQSSTPQPSKVNRSTPRCKSWKDQEDKERCQFNMIMEVSNCVEVLEMTSSSKSRPDRMDYIIGNKSTDACVSVPWSSCLLEKGSSAIA